MSHRLMDTLTPMIFLGYMSIGNLHEATKNIDQYKMYEDIFIATTTYCK
jgi:hypothetical protein